MNHWINVYVLLRGTKKKKEGERGTKRKKEEGTKKEEERGIKTKKIKKNSQIHYRDYKFDETLLTTLDLEISQLFQDNHAFHYLQYYQQTFLNPYPIYCQSKMTKERKYFKIAEEKKKQKKTNSFSWLTHHRQIVWNCYPIQYQNKTQNKEFFQRYLISYSEMIKIRSGLLESWINNTPHNLQ